MKNFVIYTCLGLIILFGIRIILFDYAFSELSVQRRVAGILSICGFTFTIATWLEYEKRKNEDKK